MSELLGKLRKLNPHKVVVYNGEDARVVAVPTRRRRWPAVMEAIESLPWTRCVLQDKSGSDLGYVEGEAPDDAPVELQAGPPGSVEDRAMRYGMAVAELAMKAHREALSYRDKELTTILRAQGEVLKDQQGAIRALQSLWQAQVDAATDLATMQAETAAGNGEFNMKEAMAALPQILPLLPALKQLLSGGKPPS